MAWEGVKVWVEGANLLASQFNKYLRNNLRELWKGTQKGDMDYYDTATTKARIEIGSEGQLFRTRSDGIPGWLNALIPTGESIWTGRTYGYENYTVVYPEDSKPPAYTDRQAYYKCGTYIYGESGTYLITFSVSLGGETTSPNNNDPAIMSLFSIISLEFRRALNQVLIEKVFGQTFYLGFNGSIRVEIGTYTIYYYGFSGGATGAFLVQANQGENIELWAYGKGGGGGGAYFWMNQIRISD